MTLIGLICSNKKTVQTRMSVLLFVNYYCLFNPVSIFQDETFKYLLDMQLNLATEFLSNLVNLTYAVNLAVFILFFVIFCDFIGFLIVFGDSLTDDIFVGIVCPAAVFSSVQQSFHQNFIINSQRKTNCDFIVQIFF